MRNTLLTKHSTYASCNFCDNSTDKTDIYEMRSRVSFKTLVVDICKKCITEIKSTKIK